PGDIEVDDDARGIGNPPGKLRVIRSDDLAALVSEVDLSQPLGSPEDMEAHKEILDASAEGTPVLPLRFGAVLESKEQVTEELLKAHHDEFASALSELEGKAQYVVRGRYPEEAVLAEMLAENPDIAEMAEQIRGKDPDATRDVRIQLGEAINNAISAKREQDSRAAADAMADVAVASVTNEPTHERDAVHMAFLVEADKQDEVQRVVDDLAEKWEGRVELRLLGPMAAYDFVGTTAGQG
ncbi:MAG: GvpL/GvpF family gas vesicle protein, partial [Streptosporangiaceae bacterium]|nr:GvpL/GvpF family gas vesicle protein [Streptosporangiaceae bacterium]